MSSSGANLYLSQRPRLEGETQADVEATVGRSLTVARGVAAVTARADPATTTDNALDTSFGANGIGLRLFIVSAIPVAAPLEDVTRHVKETEFVGLLGSHGVRTVVGAAATYNITVAVVPE